MSGNGVTGCTRGDCISLRHEMCPNNKACYDSTCVGLKRELKRIYISIITELLKIRAVQHFAEATPAVPRVPSAGEWTIRPSVPVR